MENRAMVTFETKCYEKDWEFILGGKHLDTMIARCNYPFAEKILYINNVQDPGKVKRHADKKVSKGIIDKYVLVDDHATAALDFFQVEKASFKGGYYYSIAEMVSLYLCKTPYLLHFSSDAMLEINNVAWIEKAIDLMESDAQYLVANPVWNGNYPEAQAEATAELPGFYVGDGFSDQCYLMRTDVFRQPIYNEQHPDSARYPAYGGELFEKRVDSYLRNHGGKRLTSKEVSYVHENFPTKSWERLRRRYLGK